MEPQDAWAAEKLASHFGYGDAHDFQSLGPYATLAIAQQDSARALKEKELADRSAWKQAKTRAMLEANLQNNETERWKTGELGRQKMELQDQSTTGIPFGREQLASKEAIERWKAAQQNATLRAAMDQRMKITEMQAGSRSGRQMTFGEFVQNIAPSMKYPKGTDLEAKYMEMMNRFQNAQNPIRQQLMQRQQGQQPGAPQQPPMISPHQQGIPPQVMGPQAMLTPEDYYELGLNGLGWG